MYQIVTTNSFEKDVMLCQKRGYDMDLLYSVMNLLSKDGRLPSEYKPHRLNGKYRDKWECHIKSDWILVWKQIDKQLVLLFTNTGTHSDLF